MEEICGRLKRSGSLAIMASMLLTSLLALTPLAVAPPLQGTLNVTFHNLAPNTSTFPGDMNVTMIWLEMTASGGAVQVNSVDFTLGGSILPGEVDSVALWDDAGPPPTPDKKQQWYECELGRDPVSSSSFSVTISECTGPGSYTVNDFQTRYILVYLTVGVAAAEGRTIRLSVDAINTDGTVNGGTGTTWTIEVMHIFFVDDMEAGQGLWTREGADDGHMHEPDGLWHLSFDEEDCTNNGLGLPFFHSYNTAWWYGRRFEDPSNPGQYSCGYYTHMPGNPYLPTHNLGNLTTPDVDATTGSSLVLTFWYMISTETDFPGQDFDPAHLWLFDGSWHKITPEVPSYGTSDTRWWKETINISAYAGKHVQLEFRFDTLDGINNLQYHGWFVDDFALYGKTVPHDISVTENSAPPVISPSGGSLDVSAFYANIGTSDETNINIRLTVDNVTKDTGLIPSLLSGASTTETLTWNPTELGNDQWLCMEADPVAGETIVWNNKDCVLVSVVDIPVHYVYVVRSDGTVNPSAQATWDYLNVNWGSFGTDSVVIDYTSLDIPGITYNDISTLSPKPEVLVISSSAGYGKTPTPGMEFTDTETAALTKYTLEGHGLILTGSTLNESLPNNNDLAYLVGVQNQGYKRMDVTAIDIDPACTSHPLFTNVADPFNLAFYGTTSPPDGRWDASDLTTGQYCAKSTGVPSGAIVVNKGVYLISFGAERVPTTDVYQLLYNAMTTAQYQSLNHDVAAGDIVAPNFVRVGYGVNVSATITNLGKNDDSVDVTLNVNGVPQDTTNIFLTAAGGYQRVTLSYTPTSTSDDNVCMRGDIVGFADEDPTNNEVCKTVSASNNPPVQVFVLDSWGTDNGTLAPWGHLNQFWSDYGETPVFIDWTTFNKENIQYQELVDMYADVLLISSSYFGVGNPGSAGYVFTTSEMNAIKQYVQEGHGIIITGGTFDTEYAPTHLLNLGSLMGITTGLSYMTYSGVNNLEVLNPTENHPLFINIPTHYNTVSGLSLTPGFSISGPENWGPAHLSGAEYKALEDTGTLYGAVIAYEPGTYNAVYITNFVERSSGTNDRQLLYNAMVWGRTTVKAPSDLWVELYNGGVDLRLTWTENPSPNLLGYRVYRAESVDTFDFGSPHYTLPVGTTQYVDPFTGIGDTNNYYYVVRAYDSKGNEEQNRNTVGKYVITIYPKTNEISLPFELRTTATSVVFAQLGNDYSKIEAYDALTGTWKYWTTTGGDLTDVDHKMGLRVTMKGNAPVIDFVTVGRVPSLTDIDMYYQPASSFWNFVGFPRHVTTPLPDALDNYGMMGKYDLVLWYDPLDKKNPWKWFNPNDPGGNSLTELSPGMGIWVHTTQAGTWSLPGR